jgi:hypothetical protein
MFVLVVFATTALVLLAYEWWAVANHRPTITQTIRSAYEFYPPTGFLVGLVAGALLAHFFWYR